jgi:DNA sulfur modification protein DndB
LQEEWSKGESDNGFLSINAGVESLIRIFSDIIDHLVAKNVINAKKDSVYKIVDELKYYLDPLIDYFKTLTTDEKYDLRKSYGTKYHGDNWFKSGLPKSVYDSSIQKAADKNYEAKTKAEEVEPWDCLNIIDYRKIATYGKNWSEIFEKNYIKPGEEKIRGGKDAKTGWMQKLERIRNQNFHSYSVKEEEYEFLKELYDWLVNKTVENELE